MSDFRDFIFTKLMVFLNGTYLVVVLFYSNLSISTKSMEFKYVHRKNQLYGILHIYRFVAVFLLAKYTYNISIAMSSGPSDHESLLAQGKGSHANHVTL